MAGSVADVLDRRTRASLRDALGAADSAHEVAALIGPELGWDGDRARREADDYGARVRAEWEKAGLRTAAGGEAGAGPAVAVASGGDEEAG
jgi:glycerol-3-phosphate dehydrogenase